MSSPRHLSVISECDSLRELAGKSREQVKEKPAGIHAAVIRYKHLGRSVNFANADAVHIGLITDNVIQCNPQRFLLPAEIECRFVMSISPISSGIRPEACS